MDAAFEFVSYRQTGANRPYWMPPRNHDLPYVAHNPALTDPESKKRQPRTK